MHFQRSMDINRLCTSVFISIVFFCVCLAQSNIFPYDAAVYFGDSMTDTGNVFNLTGNRWPPSPYYRGRFCDGPIWVDRLNLSKTVNYAHGSATTDNNIIPGYTTSYDKPVPGVRQQINTYKNMTDLSKIDFSRTIYMIWVGGNDYFFSNMSLQASVVVASIINGINDLIGIGGEKFLLVNQPPFQLYPAVSSNNMNDFFRKLTSEHNGNLSQSIDTLRKKYPAISFLLLDAYALIQDIQTYPTTYGVTNFTNCWSIITGSIIQMCTNSSNFLFIDEYHLTSHAHQLIADRARNLLITSYGIVLLPFSYGFHLVILVLLLTKNFI